MCYVLSQLCHKVVPSCHSCGCPAHNSQFRSRHVDGLLVPCQPLVRNVGSVISTTVTPLFTCGEADRSSRVDMLVIKVTDLKSEVRSDL